ncbi:protein MANNAN SYNTHESIS-RELATED 2-like [Ipomoea triloba]|uniref:protein MANNAN SYNTHESIS-RELATED 2-like n=1 Tax=Ipomoea triloba TaxID=35885 RepID=UPI00125D8C49|nr:protein MANNAN SYNTHESIS-RELATED 2-like [Ipomoea triloba]
MFGEIYDLEKFTASLDEKVAQRLLCHGSDGSGSMFTILELYVHNFRMNPYVCLGTFDTLMLRPELQESIDSMVATLKSLNPNNSEGRFVAVDYKVETMPQSSTHVLLTTQLESNIALMQMNQTRRLLVLKMKQLFVYLTLNGWHTRIEHLRNIFPNTFTKDAIVPVDKKSKFLDPERPELKKIVDFYVSSAADFYVPTSSNLFSENVVARRIATGETQVLFLCGPTDLHFPQKTIFLLTHQEKKHWAYSCFC